MIYTFEVPTLRELRPIKKQTVVEINALCCKARHILKVEIINSPKVQKINGF